MCSASASLRLFGHEFQNQVYMHSQFSGGAIDISWFDDVTDLYDILVDCAMCEDSTVRLAVVDALKSYKMLLKH